MKKMLIAATMVAGFSAPLAAAERYDRSIDEAAARIVAAKIGGLRGPFAPDEEPVFVTSAKVETTGGIVARKGGWHRGMARARDPLAAMPASF